MAISILCIWHHCGRQVSKKLNLRIVNATSQKLTLTSEIWIEGRIVMIFRERWHSIITSSSPNQYEYADEMLSGPFKKWRHLHSLMSITITITKAKSKNRGNR
jgi:ligand-binding SRPBCC domain-containing protein